MVELHTQQAKVVTGVMEPPVVAEEEEELGLPGGLVVVGVMDLSSSVLGDDFIAK